jgi:hypothetical protein
VEAHAYCRDGLSDLTVLRFCNARLSRRGWPAVQMSRLFIIGVDGLKSQIMNRLARGRSVRFSDRLEARGLAPDDTCRAWARSISRNCK